MRSYGYKAIEKRKYMNVLIILVLEQPRKYRTMKVFLQKRKAEIDLNPIIINGAEPVVADALIVLGR
jgi:hypothetical protein